MIEYCKEDLAKKIKKAKETNNLEREKYLKGLSRFLSLVENFYKILENYEFNEDFREFHKFFYSICEIFRLYLCEYIDGKKVSLDKLKDISSCLAYGYYFYGGGIDHDGTEFLCLGKCIEDEEEEDYEDLNIPIPVRKTDEWYNRFKSLNIPIYLPIHKD